MSPTRRSFSVVRSSLAVPQRPCCSGQRVKTFEIKITHLRHMQGLIRVLQSVTISLLSRVRPFPPLQGSPAFFMPLFTEVRGIRILGSWPVKRSRKFDYRWRKQPCKPPNRKLNRKTNEFVESHSTMSSDRPTTDPSPRLPAHRIGVPLRPRAP